jgi:CBS domain-containing protein
VPSDSSSDDEPGNEKGNRKKIEDRQFRLTYDADEGLPETPENERLDWRVFNEDFNSTEPDIKKVEGIMDANEDQCVDLRSYMIINPFVCAPHDDLDRVNELFRHHHLRHLPVVNPGNGALVGIITRKDLFKYMSL